MAEDELMGYDGPSGVTAGRLATSEGTIDEELSSLFSVVSQIEDMVFVPSQEKVGEMPMPESKIVMKRNAIREATERLNKVRGALELL